MASVMMKSLVYALVVVALMRGVDSQFCDAKDCKEFPCARDYETEPVCFECTQRDGSSNRINVHTNLECDKRACCECKGDFRFCHVGVCSIHKPCLHGPPPPYRPIEPFSPREHHSHHNETSTKTTAAAAAAAKAANKTDC